MDNCSAVKFKSPREAPCLICSAESSTIFTNLFLRGSEGSAVSVASIAQTWTERFVRSVTVAVPSWSVDEGGSSGCSGCCHGCRTGQRFVFITSPIVLHVSCL